MSAHSFSSKIKAKSEGNLSHRPLFLQHASIFEHFGGVEYYLDDFVSLASGLYGKDQTHTVVPASGPAKVTRPYNVELVSRSTNRFIKKLQNRFFGDLYRRASQIIRQTRPTLIFNAHVSLGPLCHLLGAQHHLPVVTCVYGIEAWGDLFFQDEWCLKRAKRIVSISDWTKQILVKRGYPTEQIDIVHPLLPQTFEAPPTGAKAKREKVTLLTVSRLDAAEQYKGQDHVIQALSQLLKKDPLLPVEYIIQGEGSDRTRLEKMVAELNLQSVVRFADSIKDRNALRENYQQADLFVMPSRFGKWDGHWRGEGFGIVYVEAASMRVPSLAYRCGGVMDIIRDQETGWLVEPDNIVKLAAVLHDLITHPRKLIDAGNRARDWVLEAFTTTRVTEQLIHAFNQVPITRDSALRS